MGGALAFILLAVNPVGGLYAAIPFAILKLQYAWWIPLSAVFMMMAGFGMFMTGACCNTILQTIVDDDKRGRVMSYYTMFFIGSAPIGHIGGGWLAEHIGAPFTFLVGGVIALLAGIVFALQMPAFRRELRPVYVTRGIIPASTDKPN